MWDEKTGRRLDTQVKDEVLRLSRLNQKQEAEKRLSVNDSGNQTEGGNKVKRMEKRYPELKCVRIGAPNTKVHFLQQRAQGVSNKTGNTSAFSEEVPTGGGRKSEGRFRLKKTRSCRTNSF